jgi:hypothetical protein
MREWWQLRYPSFWDALKRKVSADTAAALRSLAPPLRLLRARTVYGRTVAAVESRTEGYPRISLGDLLAKVFHDWDNRNGLVLDDGGVVFGDGCLDQGVTRERAVGAARAGIDEVEVAYDLGRRGTAIVGGPLYAEVREATRAGGDRFVSEASIPRLSGDNPPQNWQVSSVEELWETPIVGCSGATVGESVSQALEAGEELPKRLGCLGRGVTGALDVPAVPGLREWLSAKACQAYHEGFLNGLMSDPKRCVLDVVAGARHETGGGVTARTAGVQGV